MPVPLRWAIVILLVIGLISIPYFLLSSTVAANPISTSSLRSTFKAQSNVLAGPIGALGITEHPTASVQCVDDSSTTWMTNFLCLDEYNYPFNTRVISKTALSNYPTNAAKFDALLLQNEWINDRPHDLVTTVAASNPYLPASGGEGAEVPFHKNFGNISCNLEIGFNSLTGVIHPGSINVNQFSCQQEIQLFMPGAVIPGGGN
jgi:hypothetical protein